MEGVQAGGIGPETCTASTAQAQRDHAREPGSAMTDAGDDGRLVSHGIEKTNSHSAAYASRIHATLSIRRR